MVIIFFKIEIIWVQSFEGIRNVLTKEHKHVYGILLPLPGSTQW